MEDKEYIYFYQRNGHTLSTPNLNIALNRAEGQVLEKEIKPQA